MRRIIQVSLLLALASCASQSSLYTLSYEAGYQACADSTLSDQMKEHMIIESIDAVAKGFEAGCQARELP